jgi:ribosomal protein L37E
MVKQPCPNCHSTIPEGAVFCPVCGFRLAEEGMPAGQNAPGTAPTTQTLSCPRCGYQHNPPLPSHCQACGYPLSSPDVITPTPSALPSLPIEQKDEPAPGVEIHPPASTITPPKKRLKVPPTRPIHLKGAVRKAVIPLFGVVILVALGILAWRWWQNRSVGGTAQPVVEACQPVTPGDDFEPANQRDLQGDLHRDSYFKASEEYTIAENAEFTVPQGVTLIIEPGARVKFGPGAKMIVQGTLLACGRGSRRILFTADTTAGRPGFWAGIEFRNADPDTVLGHATFEFAGKDAHAPLWIENTDLHVEDVKFDSNQWYALSLDPDSYPRLRPPISVENGPLGWEVRGGTLNKSRSWSKDQPYVVNGVIEVAEKASLTVQAGAWVKFQPGSALNVLGKLEAVGTSGEPIRFTSVNEGAEEGAPEPQAGDWVGVRIVGRKAEARLELVELRYAGAEARERGCLWLSEANPVLTDVTISECAGFALSTDIASNPQIERLTLSETDPLRRWELRQSTLEGVTSRRLSKLFTADQAPLYPVLTGWVGAGEGATLAIDPGTTLLFAGGDQAGLWVNGVLQANGSENEPIVLTSWRDPEFNRAGGAQPGDWGGLHLKNSAAEETSLTFVEIRYAGAVENSCLWLQSASPKISNLKISDCVAYPISSDAASQPDVENLDLSDNPHPNLWEIRESSLKERAEWTWRTLQTEDGAQIIRLVTGFITVEKDATLRLQAGSIVKFASGTGIVARGGLFAEGTPETPIILTSWRDPEGGGKESGAQPGDWAGIALDGSRAADLSHVHIRYAGRPDWGVGCLNVKESQPTLDNLTIEHCNYYPVTSDLASDPQVVGLSLQDNQPADEWAIRESTLAKGNQRSWGAIVQAEQNNPILRTVIGWLTVENGARLILGEGVVVKFADGVGLVNRGALNMTGNAQSPVILTSWRDPQFSNESGVQAGDWAGLVFESAQGDTLLSHVEIRYAGGRGNLRGAINLSASSPALSDVTIRDTAWYPISVDAQSMPRLERITLLNNARAVEMRGGELQSAGEQVWSPWVDIENQPIVRVLMENLVIGPEAALRLASGVIVKFDVNAGLDVRGGLLAEGAVFTSLHDDETGGDTDGSASDELAWLGIKIRGRKLTRLENSLIRYAQVGLWMEDAAPTLRDVRIEDNWSAALSSDFRSAPEIENLSLKRNAINGLLINADSLPEGQTRWTLIGTAQDQLVRVIPGNLTVGATSQLIIDPEVVIKFAPQSGLIVEGRLQAGQKDAETVSFTALADDSVGGDTDNSQQTPIRGFWKGIAVNPNNTNAQLALFSVIIRYASTSLEVLNPVEWQVSSLSVEESQLYGISCAATFETFVLPDEITFTNNGQDISGCQVAPLPTPTITPELLTPIPTVTPFP